MNWLRQIRARLHIWRNNHELAALLKDIEYHKRAECMHCEAAWQLTQEWRAKQKKYPLSHYARQIQHLGDLNDFEEAERIGKKVREIAKAAGISDPDLIEVKHYSATEPREVVQPVCKVIRLHPLKKS